ncbi:MAG: vWA domain-containing protein [Planctomycetota bacterium]
MPIVAGLAVALPLLPLLLRFLLRKKLRTSVALHVTGALVAALLLLALAGPGWETIAPRRQVAVIALDVSDSIPPGERKRAAAEAALLARRLEGKGIEVHRIEFDGTVQERRADGPNAPQDAADPAGASRVVPVLLYTLGKAPSGGRGRLFLYSDGWFSDAPSPVNLPKGLVVHTFPLRPLGSTKVIVSSIEFRPPLEEGTPTLAAVEVESNAPGTGVVTLYRNQKRLGSREIVLAPGSPTRATFSGLRLQRGTHRMSARFESRDESLPSTKPAFVDVRVDGPPQVFLVDQTPPLGVPVLKALQTQGIELTAATWEEGGSAESLEKFDAFVLIAPPASAARGELASRLARVVRGGGGMIVVADKIGFGPAYRDTALAAAVPVLPPAPHLDPPPAEPDPEPEPKIEDPPPPPPVEDPPPPEEEDPPTERKPVELGSVALVFLIDKSGSMAGKKIRLAKEAAIAAASALGAENTIGVLAFDTEATWLVPLTTASRRDWIIDRVSRLQAGGGTNIFPALVKSLNALKTLPARIRHVILISDGYNKTLEDFKGVVSNMAKAGISLSTIGVGDQFDSRLLSSLTFWAGGEKGRFDFTRDPGRIPRLVIRQTRWAVGKKEDEPKRPPRKRRPLPRPIPCPRIPCPPRRSPRSRLRMRIQPRPRLRSCPCVSP